MSDELTKDTRSSAPDCSAPEPDLKAIVKALAQRVMFAIRHCKCGGTGTLFDSDTGESQHWKDYMADGIDMIPGHKVDREAMHALSLPKKERDRFFAAREDAKKSEQNARVEATGPCKSPPIETDVR